MLRPALTLALCLTASIASAWSQAGHHIVALLAYDLLPSDQQDELRELLTAHPRYAEDFDPPPKVDDVDRWRVGTTGYWADVARRQPTYNRPTWHYELGATLVLGEGSDVPDYPGPLPAGSDLETRELYASQAFALCREVLGDRGRPSSDRALALCWLAHIVGDTHQPCHAGSLYADVAYPDGDRGGNEIKTAQRRNLHALWDGLLGPRYDEGDVAKRLREITSDAKVMRTGEAFASRLDPQVWLAESREAAKRTVYTGEVLAPVRAVVEGKADSVPQIRLSEDYLKTAGRMARLRACMAGWRLARVWGAGL